MLRIEIERERDWRWFGEVAELPGVIAYDPTKAEARTNTIALAFRVLGERIARGEPMPINCERSFRRRLRRWLGVEQRYAKN